MDDISPAEEPKRFVPLGVDAQSWLGFEQRIQERRYRALLQQIDEAIARRDTIAARLALEEARELRPDAEDLNELSGRVALIPVALPLRKSPPFVWSRAMNAVSMLVAGVGLLVAIESVRPPRPLPSRTIASSVATAPALTVPSGQPALDTATIPADSIVASVEPDVAIPDPVATNGIRPAVNIARPAVGGPATTPFRPEAFAGTGLQERPRAIPDDDAAQEPRRQRETSTAVVENVPVATANADTTAGQPSRVEVALAAPREVPPERPAAPPALVASIAPNPTSVVLVPPIAAAAAPAPVLEPRTRVSDETRVTQILDQYARAYDQLDVRAARRVWPTVDERALSRAFAGLASQDVSFENCNVTVSGPIATASCRGSATYVGKIGSHERRTEARQWTFELRRDANDAWQIERAQAQRMAN